MDDREELAALRRMAELEDKSGAAQNPIAPQPVQMNPLQARMGIRGQRAGQGAEDLLPKAWDAFSNAGYNLGGAVTDATGLPALGTAANLSTEAAQMMIGGGTAKLAKVPAAVEGAGKWLMGKALSPLAADWKSGKAERAVGTMLEQGYNPTKGGVQAMRDKVSGLDDEVTNIISSSSKELNTDALVERLLGVYDKYLAGGSAKEVKNIGEVAKDFTSNPGIAGQDAIPIQLAQQIKQTMGSDLGSAAYGMGLKSAAERDAKKALVRALKEDIAKAEPAVAPLNAQSSELLNAVKIAERKAILEGNMNPMPLLPAIAATAHDPMATVGLWANSSALAKSLAARLLYNNRNTPIAAGRLVGAAAGAPGSLPPEEQQ